ncbi:MAG TPA: CAP domain-containing protein [Rhizomicrobium sp.]|jgi:hypothetical protein
MRRWVVLGAVLVLAHAPDAAAFTPNEKIEILSAHNRYRWEVGVPALRWSDELAATALLWAQHLAEVRRFEHSGALGTGENLAMWTAGKSTLTQLVDLWGAEKRFFIQSYFPDVSKIGDWRTVGHYTQIVWRDTTEVGCGRATGGGYDFLVCQYAPQGNFMGRRVF